MGANGAQNKVVETAARKLRNGNSSTEEIEQASHEIYQQYLHDQQIKGSIGNSENNFFNETFRQLHSRYPKVDQATLRACIEESCQLFGLNSEGAPDELLGASIMEYIASQI